jgi:predicted ATP-dependent serine protease
MATTREKMGDPCRECKTPMAYGTARCPNPKCRAWNFGSGGEAEVEFVRLSDAKVSIVPRIKTLHPAVDAFFGGTGIVQSSTCLLAAPPGWGKSTFQLQFADYTSQQCNNRDVAYVANEQSPDEIRAKALELGIKNLHQVCVINMMGGMKGSLFDVIMRMKPCLTIVDSLTKLVGRDLDFAVVIASEFKSLSVELQQPTILINQVTKELDHAGLEKLQHEVDCTALGHMEGAKRYLVSEKNRNGPAPMILAMRMRSEAEFACGEGGLEVLGIVDEDAEEDENGDRPINSVGEGDTDKPEVHRLQERN